MGGLIQTDGPFGPHQSLARRNLGLVALLIPAALVAIGLRGPSPVETTAGLATALAGSIIGFWPFRAQSRTDWADFDWLVQAILSWLLIYPLAGPHQALTVNLAISFGSGLISGRLTAWLTRTRWGRAPALVPLATTTLSLILTHLALVFQATWPPCCPLTQTIMVPWGEATALVVAGLIFLKSQVLRLTALVALLGVILLSPDFYNAGPSLVALTLAIFFLAPQLAKTKGELISYELILLTAAWQPWSQTPQGPIAHGYDPAPLVATAIIVGLSMAYDRARSSWRKKPTLPPTTRAKARLKCGHQGQAPSLAEWQGLPSCRLAQTHDQGHLLCPYGCLGLGDCQCACPFAAITLNEAGFPIFHPDLCRGCGTCELICPKNLITLLEEPGLAFIPCSARSSLKKNATYCPQACLGCGQCRKACPAQAISRDQSVGAMTIDQTICQNQGGHCQQVCAPACPRQIISRQLDFSPTPLTATLTKSAK